MRIPSLWWSWYDWSLAYRFTSDGPVWKQLFALKCAICRKFRLGCKDHWFCGLCDPCADLLESNEAWEQDNWPED